MSVTAPPDAVWITWANAKRKYGLKESALIAYVHQPGVRMQHPPAGPDGSKPRDRYIHHQDLVRAMKRRTTTSPHYEPDYTS